MESRARDASAFDLAGPFDAWLHHRSLTLEMSKRDVLGRYREASFGLLWSLISPFLMLLIYTLAFGYILKSRWPGTSGNIADFSMLLFVGLIVHGFFRSEEHTSELQSLMRSSYAVFCLQKK